MAMKEKTIIHLIFVLCLMQFEELKAQELKSGVKRAFLVACGDQHEDKSLNLPKAVEDVEKFRQSLLRTGYKAEDIMFMEGKAGVDLKYQPLRDAIMKQLELMVKGLNEGDTLVVALNGHGIHPKGAKTTYFVPLNGEIDKEKTLIPMDGANSIYGMLKEAQKKKARVLLIVGACRNEIKGNVQAQNQMDLGDPDVPPEGVAAIYSCGVGQKTYFDEKGGSYFYEHLSKAWLGEYHPSDENITLEMVFKEVREKTFRDVASLHNKDQNPEIRREYKGEWLINKNDLEIRSILDVYLPLAFKRQNYKARQVLENINSQRMNSIRLFASKNSPEALLLQGICLFEGVHLVKDYEEAFRAFKKSAESGHPVGMLFCGLCYRDGIGVSRNNDEAYKWIMKSAEKGETSGMNAAGDCFMHGIGVNKDKKQAFKWYSQSANQNDSQGMVGVGNCLLYGRGTNIDKFASYTWYLKSAKLGNTDALVSLGHLLLECDERWKINKKLEIYKPLGWEKVDGVDWKKLNAQINRDDDKIWDCLWQLACFYYQHASELGNTDGMIYWGKNSSYISKPISKNESDFHFEKWLKKSSDFGNTHAMNIIAQKLMEGIEYEQNKDNVYKFLKKSTETGDATGMHLLGNYFSFSGLLGGGIQCCKYGGFGYGSNEFVKNSQKAQEFLNDHVIKKPDFNNSYNWYKKAADFGYYDSMLMIEMFYRRGIGTKINEEKADFYKEQSNLLIGKDQDYLGDSFLYDTGLLHYKPFIQRLGIN